MAKDHFSKQLSQKEQLAAQINQLYQILGDIDRRLTAIARGKFDAATFAKLMLDNKANGKFMQELNTALDTEMKIQEQERNKAVAEQFAPEPIEE